MPLSGEGSYDLHMHSRHSYDCLLSPRRIIATARARGLSGIAVTDHNTIAGGAEAKALEPPDLLVIVGAEYYTTVGDVVALFLTEEIQTRDPIELVAAVHEQGGIAFLPHPLRSHKVMSEAVLAAFDGYEALNSRAGWFDCRLATGQTPWSTLAGKSVLGCSDAHLPSEIGRARTIIPGPATESNVAAQLRAGHTRPVGTPGPARNFYLSQMIRALKTRDAGIVLRGVRRLARRASRKP